MCSDARLLLISAAALGVAWLAIAGALGWRFLIASARDRRFAAELRALSEARDAASQRRERAALDLLATLLGMVRR